MNKPSVNYPILVFNWCVLCNSPKPVETSLVFIGNKDYKPNITGFAFVGQEIKAFTEIFDELSALLSHLHTQNIKDRIKYDFKKLTNSYPILPDSGDYRFVRHCVDLQVRVGFSNSSDAVLSQLTRQHNRINKIKFFKVFHKELKVVNVLETDGLIVD